MRGKTKRKLQREVQASLSKLGQFSKWKGARKAQTQNRLEVSRTWKGERKRCLICGEEFSLEFFSVVLVSTFRGESRISGNVCYACVPQESLVKSRLKVSEVPKLFDVLQKIEDAEKTRSDRNKKG